MLNRRNWILGLIATVVLVVPSAPATASDSVRVPGQIPVEQCPIGYQYNTGIEVNVSTHEEFTICNAPPSESENLLRQQDVDFRAAQDAAIATATHESQAWNAANPGMQKCVQWGPVVHANGVSTASGGVCANPVAANDASSLPTAPADEVSGNDPVFTTQSLDTVDTPFVREIDGQVGLEGCPAGYKGANGLTVNVSTGRLTTQCWTPAAWQAWTLGGTVWEQYQSSGGAYDVAAEVDRRAKLAALKSQARTVAQSAANQTPGLRRCSTWVGYGETGSECAYTFIAPKDGLQQDGSRDTTDSNDSTDSTDATETATQNVSAQTNSSAGPNVVTVAAASVTSSKTYTLVNPVKKAKVVTKSLTPKVCSVASLKVKARTKGTCVISYKSTTVAGKVSVTKKTIVFAKSS